MLLGHRTSTSLSSEQTESRRSYLSGVVPGDVDSGVQLRRGSAVQDQPRPLQGLHGPAGVQVDLRDVAHWDRRREDGGLGAGRSLTMLRRRRRAHLVCGRCTNESASRRP